MFKSKNKKKNKKPFCTYYVPHMIVIVRGTGHFVSTIFFS